MELGFAVRVFHRVCVYVCVKIGLVIFYVSHATSMALQKIWHFFSRINISDIFRKAPTVALMLRLMFTALAVAENREGHT